MCCKQKQLSAAYLANNDSLLKVPTIQGVQPHTWMPDERGKTILTLEADDTPQFGVSLCGNFFLLGSKIYRGTPESGGNYYRLLGTDTELSDIVMGYKVFGDRSINTIETYMADLNTLPNPLWIVQNYLISTTETDYYSVVYDPEADTLSLVSTTTPVSFTGGYRTHQGNYIIDPNGYLISPGMEENTALSYIYRGLPFMQTVMPGGEVVSGLHPFSNFYMRAGGLYLPGGRVYVMPCAFDDSGNWKGMTLYANDYKTQYIMSTYFADTDGYTLKGGNCGAGHFVVKYSEANDQIEGGLVYCWNGTVLYYSSFADVFKKHVCLNENAWGNVLCQRLALINTNQVVIKAAGLSASICSAREEYNGEEITRYLGLPQMYGDLSLIGGMDSYLLQVTKENMNRLIYPRAKYPVPLISDGHLRQKIYQFQDNEHVTQLTMPIHQAAADTVDNSVLNEDNLFMTPHVITHTYADDTLFNSISVPSSPSFLCDYPPVVMLPKPGFMIGASVGPTNSWEVSEGENYCWDKWYLFTLQEGSDGAPDYWSYEGVFDISPLTMSIPTYPGQGNCNKCPVILTWSSEEVVPGAHTTGATEDRWPGFHFPVWGSDGKLYVEYFTMFYEEDDTNGYQTMNEWRIYQVPSTTRKLIPLSDYAYGNWWPKTFSAFDLEGFLKDTLTLYKPDELADENVWTTVKSKILDSMAYFMANENFLDPSTIEGRTRAYTWVKDLWRIRREDAFGEKEITVLPVFENQPFDTVSTADMETAPSALATNLKGANKAVFGFGAINEPEDLSYLRQIYDPSAGFSYAGYSFSSEAASGFNLSYTIAGILEALNFVPFDFTFFIDVYFAVGHLTPKLSEFAIHPFWHTPVFNSSYRSFYETSVHTSIQMCGLPFMLSMDYAFWPGMYGLPSPITSGYCLMYKALTHFLPNFTGYAGGFNDILWRFPANAAWDLDQEIVLKTDQDPHYCYSFHEQAQKAFMPHGNYYTKRSEGFLNRPIQLTQYQNGIHPLQSSAFHPEQRTSFIEQIAIWDANGSDDIETAFSALPTYLTTATYGGNTYYICKHRIGIRMKLYPVNINNPVMRAVFSDVHNSQIFSDQYICLPQKMKSITDDDGFTSTFMRHEPNTVLAALGYPTAEFPAGAFTYTIPAFTADANGDLTYDSF